MIIINKNSDVKIHRTAYNNSGGVLDVSAATIVVHFRETSKTLISMITKLSAASQIDLTTNGVYIINLDYADFALLIKKNYYVVAKITVGTDIFVDQFMIRVEGNTGVDPSAVATPTTLKSIYIVVTNGAITTESYSGFDSDPTAAISLVGGDKLILSSTSSELAYAGIPSSNDLDWDTITQTDNDTITVTWGTGVFTSATISFLWQYYTPAIVVTSSTAATYGTTAERPVFASGTNTGFVYFDTDDESPVFWSGTECV